MSKNQTIVNWFINRRGKLTYSMYGSRNGSDGTADCSGSVSQALKDTGFSIQGLPTTVTLGQQLAKNGFHRISRNEDWKAETGDIVLMSWGVDMSTSVGSGGHVGVMIDSVYFISCDYSTKGAKGQAINTYPWNDYYSWNKPTYIEVWRYKESYPQSADNVSNGNAINDFARDVLKGKYGNGNARKENIYKTVQDEVNVILRKGNVKNNYITVIANDVLKGKYGNGNVRKESIYKAVQDEVNRIV